MTYLPQLSSAIYQGLSAAAGVLGKTFSCYRLNSSSTGAIIATGSRIYSAFPLMLERTTSKLMLENTIFDLLAFAGKGDGTKLLAGDILVDNGFSGDGGAYAVAQIRYQKPYRIVLIRVDNKTCSLKRPHPSAGSAEDQPTSGAIARLSNTAPNDYSGIDPQNRFALTLDAGLYQMIQQGSGTRASLPVGLQPLNKVQDGHKPILPTQLPRTKFVAYIPPTPGYIPSESDIIKAANQDTYEIKQIYSSEPVGLVGTIAIVEKLAV